MGKGAHGVPGDGQGDRFSREDVRQHSKPDDKWIVIDGRVYDITTWVHKHPGGPIVIGHYAGQDATGAFEAFHKDMKVVSKYMAPLEIGTVEPDKDEEIRKAYTELRRKAEEKDLFTSSKVYFGLIFLHLIFFDVMAYYIMSTYGTTWLPYICALLCNAIAMTQMAFNQHDYAHMSVFKSGRMNRIFHSIVMCILKGTSSSWWHFRHNRHHSKTNVVDRDPSIELEPMLVVGDDIPKKTAARKDSYPYKHQQYYFAIGMPLLFPLYFQYGVFRHPIKYGHYFDAFLVSLFYIRFLYLYYPLLGILGALKFLYATRVMECVWFFWISQTNHIPMDMGEDKAKPWLLLQLNAACDIQPFWFSDWFTGHLNYHIEHHLFPTMPRHNLYKIQPAVMETCRKLGIPYRNKPLFQATADLIQSLKKSGEIWEKQYRMLHNS